VIGLSFFHYKGGRQNNDKAARLEHKQNDLQTKQKAKYWRKRIVSFSILISWMKIFSVRVLWQSVFHVLVMLCWPRKESLYGKLPFHALSGEGNDYKYELTAMQFYNDSKLLRMRKKKGGCNMSARANVKDGLEDSTAASVALTPILTWWRQVGPVCSFRQECLDSHVTLCWHECQDSQIV
jgi:hypothetical protein